MTEKATIQRQDKQALWLISILSVAIPVVVAILMFLPQTGKLGGLDVSILPHVNAVLNSGTAVCLVLAFLRIRQRDERTHRAFMLTAFVLSSLFLISYVLYHFQGAHTLFGDANADGVVSDEEKAMVGGIRLFYLFILLSHIALATIVVPLVLFSFYFALSRQIDRHKKLVKFAFPIWLYVAVTGVLVYLMISPYYPA